MFVKTNNPSSNDNSNRTPTTTHQNVRLKSTLSTDKIPADDDEPAEEANSSSSSNMKTIYNNTSSAASKTILITNNIQPKSKSNAAGSADNSSSITILTSSSHNNDDDDDTEEMMDTLDDQEILENPLSEQSSKTNKTNRTTNQRSTVVLDRINICINNHYNEPMRQEAATTTTTSISSTPVKYETFVKKDEPDSTVLTPPSKDIELYKNGQDVLVLQKDGRLYLGTVIAIARNQCLVKFGDNTERWASYHELTKLSSSDVDSLPVCVVCKCQKSSDVVEVCEKCGRGYHEKCMDGGDMGLNGIWVCRRCTAQNPMRNRYGKCGSGSGESVKKMCSIDGSKKREQASVLFHKNQLPYNIDTLHWDLDHRVNAEQVYCYCGDTGDWYTRMLQCVRCEQWFHEKCIRCLQYPLYCGDRFYIFVCSMCNFGTEFSRRIELKWEDIVHLLLFNLTIYNHKKYYDLTTILIPYIIDNWEILQLPLHIKNLLPSHISEQICDTLNSNLHKTRFKNGKEIKKSAAIWGLRNVFPPPFIRIVLPAHGVVTEQYLKEHLLPSIDFIPQSSNSIVSTTSCPMDLKVYNIMMGSSYQHGISDNESSLSSETNIDLTYNSDDEIPIKELKSVAVKLKHEIDTSSNLSTPLVSHINSNSLYGHDSDNSDHDDVDDDYNHVCVVAKEYLDIDESSKMEMFNDEQKCKISGARSAITTIDDDADKMLCDSSDESSSRGTLDLIIPPPKNFQGINNPFHNHNPVTPVINSKKSKNGRAVVDVVESSKKNKRKQMVNPLAKGVAASVVCGGRIMLDSDVAGLAKKNGEPFRIVRTVKRRLSAKDILVGPNQEIKRRKVRRRSGHVEVISTQTLQSVSKTAAYLPIRTDNKDWSLSSIRSTITSNSSSPSSTPNAGTPPAANITIANMFNPGRRLRQRQEKNYAENPRRSSVSSTIQNNQVPNVTNFSLPGSPAKNGGGGGGGGGSDISITELQTSLNMYFGAANRISNGEKFFIRGRRLCCDGRYQYLVEWEGMS